ASAVAFTGCKTQPQKEKDKKTAVAKKDKAAHDESGEVDFQAFLGRLRQAVAAKDMNAIASMMTEDFGYSLNPEKSGPGVFQFWDENNLWPELEGILSEKFVKKGGFYVA